MFLSLCDTESPACVLLTDSKFGAAFFEHRYLSELLGIPLVEGSDLYVGANGRVWARAMDDDFEVDLIYRRVEDLELFVPGLTEAYLNHKVVLVNAMGTGASRHGLRVSKPAGRAANRAAAGVHSPGDAGLLPAPGLR